MKSYKFLLIIITGFMYLQMTAMQSPLSSLPKDSSHLLPLPLTRRIQRRTSPKPVPKTTPTDEFGRELGQQMRRNLFYYSPSVSSINFVKNDEYDDGKLDHVKILVAHDDKNKLREIKYALDAVADKNCPLTSAYLKMIVDLFASPIPESIFTETYLPEIQEDTNWIKIALRAENSAFLHQVNTYCPKLMQAALNDETIDIKHKNSLEEILHKQTKLQAFRKKLLCSKFTDATLYI